MMKSKIHDKKTVCLISISIFLVQFVLRLLFNEKLIIYLLYVFTPIPELFKEVIG